jgi:uncharacterized protein YcbX
MGVFTLPVAIGVAVGAVLLALALHLLGSSSSSSSTKKQKKKKPTTTTTSSGKSVFVSHAIESLEQVHITDLYVYPIKSCGAVRYRNGDAARFDRLGLEHDRRWLVVNAETRHMVTQREHAKLALVRVQFERDNSVMRISAPGMLEELLVPLKHSGGGGGDQEEAEQKQQQQTTKRVQVTVWDDKIQAQRCSAAAARWFTMYIAEETSDGGTRRKRRFELVRTLPEAQHSRPANAKYATKQTHKHRVQAAFADGFPFLLCSESSLVELNRRIALTDGADATVAMTRFRPNIVVAVPPRMRRDASDTTPSLLEPFAEDAWREIRLLGGGGDNKQKQQQQRRSNDFVVAKPCSRCPVTMVDQQHGRAVKCKQPLKAMRAFRKIQAPENSHVYFGVNLVQMLPRGELRVGDVLQVTRAHVADNDKLAPSPTAAAAAAAAVESKQD